MPKIDTKFTVTAKGMVIIMADIRWGIVGTGGIAHRFASACLNAPGARLAAVASRNPETADAFADEFGIEKRFGSYEAMARSQDIDAAYIAVPHGVHAGCAALMMNNKKAVLCEKPLAVNEKEVLQLIDCHNKNKVFFMEAMWARLVPGTVELIRLVKSGVIGKVLGIEGDFCYDMSDEPEHHAFKPEYGGGSLLDVGVYGLNFASWFADSPVAQIKAVAHIGERSGVDEHCCVLIEYENGCLASISSGMTVKKPNSGFIYGEKGYIHVNHFYANEKIELNIYGEQPREILNPYMGNGFEEQIIECCRRINEGQTESPLLELAHTLEITRQMDSIRKQIGLKYPQD